MSPVAPSCRQFVPCRSAADRGWNQVPTRCHCVTVVLRAELSDISQLGICAAPPTPCSGPEETSPVGPPVPVTPDGSFLSHSLLCLHHLPGLGLPSGAHHVWSPPRLELALFSPARDSSCLKPGPEGAAAEIIPMCSAAHATSGRHFLPRCPLWPVAPVLALSLHLRDPSSSHPTGKSG